MRKPKKEIIELHIKPEASLMRRFESYCKEAGQTKTTAFERIVEKFLDERETGKRK